MPGDQSQSAGCTRAGSSRPAPHQPSQSYSVFSHLQDVLTRHRNDARQASLPAEDQEIWQAVDLLGSAIESFRREQTDADYETQQLDARVNEVEQGIVAASKRIKAVEGKLDMLGSQRRV